MYMSKYLLNSQYKYVLVCDICILKVFQSTSAQIIRQLNYKKAELQVQVCTLYSCIQVFSLAPTLTSTYVYT